MLLILLMLIPSIQPAFCAQNPELGAGEITSEEPECLSKTSLSPCYCRDVANDFQGLTVGLEFPERLMSEDAEKTEGDFDVNLYFTVLDRLSMEPGYVLDYVYDYAGIGGAPVLYARPIDRPAYQRYREYIIVENANQPAEREDFYMNHILADGTPEGFFQLALLLIQGEQFYQFWHALYNDDAIVCDLEDARACIPDVGGWTGRDELTVEEILAEVGELDLAPVVSMSRDQVKVEVVVFTDWGGFIKRSIVMEKEFPHLILEERSEVLVPYNGGIMF